MAWFSKVSLPTRAEKIRQLAQQVAASTLQAVESRVAHRLPELQLAEARGYVRARSAGIIRKELDQLLAERPSLQSARGELHRLASEASIRQVIWQELRERKHRETAAASWQRAA